MDETKLTSGDWDAILESLNYSRKKFEETDYSYVGDAKTAYEFKQKRISGVNDLINKIKNLKK